MGHFDAITKYSKWFDAHRHGVNSYYSPGDGAF